jgi:hypothetical protein
MGCGPALDVTGASQVTHRRPALIASGPAISQDIRLFVQKTFIFLLILLGFANCGFTQTGMTPGDLFKSERWAELAAVLRAQPERSAESEYEYGIALAHLEKWNDARSAFLRGSAVAPADKRFPEELAGVAFKQKRNSEARRYLHRALRIDPNDSYADDFLATIFFLDGNLEAAVLHWNRIKKPEIAALRTEPRLHIRPALLDHAITFAPLTALQLEDLRTTYQRVEHLEIFPAYRFSLVANTDGKFDTVLRAQELNGFGDGKGEALARTLRGIAFQEVTPEYDNLYGSAVNIASLARWDVDKRRYQASVSGPLWQSPQWRYWVSGGVRNENWDIRHGFTGPAPILAALNLRREEAAAEIERLMGWRWRWRVGVELSHRDERNVLPPSSFSSTLLAEGYQLKQTAALGFEIWRSAEHRASAISEFSSQAARLWAGQRQTFEKLQAGVKFQWLPQSSGDDYESLVRVRAGKTFGDLPFDELFMLGLERDNDLWLRGHIGTRDGRKGSAPLGADYFLANWETDKNAFSNGFVNLKIGPFLDAGKISNSVSQLDTRQWLVDPGAQIKIRVLGVGLIVSYGKDLRTGNNAFYATVSR